MKSTHTEMCRLALGVLHSYLNTAAVIHGSNGAQNVTVTKVKPVCGLQGYRVQIGTQICFRWCGIEERKTSC